MKKWTWNDTDRAVFAIGAMAGAVFLIVLCVFLVKAAKGDVEAWAAWAQALGSIIAVAVAIAVPNHMLRLERKASRQKSVDEALLNIELSMKSATYMSLMLAPLQSIFTRNTPSEVGDRLEIKTFQSKLRLAIDTLREANRPHVIGEKAAIQVMDILSVGMALQAIVSTYQEWGFPKAAIIGHSEQRFRDMSSLLTSAWETLDALKQSKSVPD